MSRNYEQEKYEIDIEPAGVRKPRLVSGTMDGTW
jgi:hypothetical protein